MTALVRALQISSPHRFTLDDVLRMQEAGILDPDARVELIDGGLVEMAPEGVPHVRVKMQIAKSLMARAGEAVEVIVDSTLRLSPTYAPDPDLYLYDARQSLASINGQTVGLIIEVAQSSLDKDLSLRAEIYGAHGVRDYWVVDIDAQEIIVHRGLNGGLYRDVVHYSARETVQPLAFPALGLCLAELPPIR
jgi:Uma2 family endonuclease